MHFAHFYAQQGGLRHPRGNPFSNRAPCAVSYRRKSPFNYLLNCQRPSENLAGSTVRIQRHFSSAELGQDQKRRGLSRIGTPPPAAIFSAVAANDSSVNPSRSVVPSAAACRNNSAARRACDAAPADRPSRTFTPAAASLI